KRSDAPSSFEFANGAGVLGSDPGIATRMWSDAMRSHGDTKNRINQGAMTPRNETTCIRTTSRLIVETPLGHPCHADGATVSIDKRSQANAFPIFARAHPGALAKESAEVKFVREIQPRRNLLDRQPLIAKKLPRLVQTQAKEKLVNGLLPRSSKHGLQSRAAHSRGARDFGHFPVALRIGHHAADRAGERLGNICLCSLEKMSRLEQTTEDLRYDDMDVP